MAPLNVSKVGMFLTRFFPEPALADVDSHCICITSQSLKADETTQTGLTLPGSLFYPYSCNSLVSSAHVQPLECLLGGIFVSHALQLSHKSDGSYYIQGIHGSAQVQPCSYPSLSPSASPALQGREDSATKTNDSHSLVVQSIQRDPVTVTLSVSLYIPSCSEVLVSCRVSASSKE